MRLPIPKAMQRRLRPMQERGERFLRDWEWTWTSAFAAGIIISFLALTLLAVVPSWMLYFADQRKGLWPWSERLFVTVRDMVVMGFLTVASVAFVVVGYKIQVIRRRLRGEKQSDRYSGGYR